MHGFGGMGFGMGWGWIIGLIGLIAVIWLVISNTYRRDSQIKPREKSALEILKERYARGEIDQQEFEEKKRNLS